MIDFENIDIFEKTELSKIGQKLDFRGHFFLKYPIFSGDAENDVYFFDGSYFLATLKPQKLYFFDFQRALDMPIFLTKIFKI